MQVRRITPALAALVVMLTALTGCAGKAATGAQSHPTGASTSFPITLRDDDGVMVTIKSPPRRIVTFAPSNTEIVFALGLGSRVVGVSGKFDNYPPAARSIPSVGGSGQFGVDPNVERVVALRPDLLLTISGGDEWKKRLRDLGIAVFTINATDFADLLHDIRTVGEVTGATQVAAALTARMAAQAQSIASKASAEPRVRCFFEAFYPPLTTVGPRTFIFDLLKRAGCDPVSVGAKSDYPEWSIDQLVASPPSIYLVASESGVSPAQVEKRPGFDAIASVRDGHVFLVDSDLISRPGPRVVQGLMALARILHPALFPCAGNC
jgi:iron complex transport system substrate-binding protein